MRERLILAILMGCMLCAGTALLLFILNVSYQAGASEARQAMPMSCSWDSVTKRGVDSADTAKRRRTPR